MRCAGSPKNGKYLANVTSNSYSASSLSAGDKITVRAANEMGGPAMHRMRLRSAPFRPNPQVLPLCPFRRGEFLQRCRFRESGGDVRLSVG